MTEYDYRELREKALRFGSTIEDRLALFEWMERYDMRSWNGECFDIDDGKSLYPIYSEEEDDQAELIDAEVR